MFETYTVFRKLAILDETRRKLHIASKIHFEIKGEISPLHICAIR